MSSAANIPSSLQQDEDIRHYSVTRWRTLFSLFQENIRSLMQKDSFRHQISDEYLNNLGERWRELQRTQYRLSFILFFLIIFIGTVGSGMTENIVLFGIRLSNENATLTILVLLSSVLMFVVSFLGLLASQYEALMKSLINSLMDQEIGKYFIQQFSWDANSIFPTYNATDGHWFVNLVIVLAGGTIILSFLLAILILVGLQLYIFASSILFIYENPRLPSHLNMPIILVATCAFLFAISELLMRMPLPYSDKSNMEKLERLEVTDPERANAIWENIAKYSLKRERRNVMVLQAVTVIFVMVACEIIVGARVFLSDYSKLIPIVLAAVVFGLVFSPLLDKYEKRLILKGARVENKELRVYMYTENKKKALRMRLAVACVFGICIFFWVQ